MNTITHCFLEADLRGQHASLANAAKKGAKVDVSKLKSGQHLLFINRKRDKMKMFSANNIVSYMKLPSGTIDLGAIKHFGSCFDKDLEMTYSQALRKRLLEGRIREH